MTQPLHLYSWENELEDELPEAINDWVKVTRWQNGCWDPNSRLSVGSNITSRGQEWRAKAPEPPARLASPGDRDGQGRIARRVNSVDTVW